MFHFYWPWCAVLLPLPFFIQKFLPASKKTKISPTCSLLFPSLKRAKQAFSMQNLGNQEKSPPFFYPLLWSSWICLVIALMQPEKIDQFRDLKQPGYDLVLAVDSSLSMQAVDFSTDSKIMSRLDATKEVVGSFVLARQGDRLALIVFGDRAHLHVPLTMDALSVKEMLDQTASGMAGNATAIGDAIGLAIKTLRERPEGSRVLILLTDGEDNASSIPPLEAAKLAKQYGIRIYTIGIGKNGFVPFPSQFGGYQKVRVSIDEELLKEIALLTGGDYFSASNQKDLQEIYQKIDTLEKSESHEKSFWIRDPFYLYPLGLSFLFFVILSLYEWSYWRGNGGFQ